ASVPSALRTDYVELEIELNVAENGYDVFVPEVSKKLLVDAPETFNKGENMCPNYLWEEGYLSISNGAPVLDNVFRGSTYNFIQFEPNIQHAMRIFSEAEGCDIY